MNNAMRAGRARRIVKAATVGVLALAGAAHATAAETKVAKRDRALIQEVAPNAVIEQAFSGPSGLTGYVIQGADGKSEPVVVWVTADHKHLLVGNLFDEWARNLTNLAAGHYDAANPIEQLVTSTIESVERSRAEVKRNTGDDQRPAEPAPSGGASATAPNASAANTEPAASQTKAKIRAAATEGRPITDPNIVAQAVGGVRALREFGSTITEREAAPDAPVVSVYYDPDCPYCHTLIRELDREALDDAGLIWIPVSVLGSTTKARLAIARGTPEAVRQSIGPGGGTDVGADTLIDEQAKDAIRANDRILRETLMAATPTTVIEYPGEQTSAMILIGSRPSQIETAIQKAPSGATTGEVAPGS